LIVLVRTALVVVLAAALGACGDREPGDSQHSQRATDGFADFCQQNPGACHETEPARSLTPAVRTRGWTKQACPRSVLEPGPGALEGVVRAMREAIPRLISVSAYGHESKLVPDNTNVLDVRPLSSHSVDLPGINTLRAFSAYYERNARRLCGRSVASRSWAAILQFPEAQAVPLSYRVMFFARTSNGWRAWYPRPGQ
jgi:hypothetical protein